MSDERNEPPNEPVRSFEDQRQALELELTKIRSEATAARLEVRAAEIELMIRQLGGSGTSTAAAELTNTPTVGTPAGAVTSAGAPISRPHFRPPRPATPAAHFADWDEVRSVLPSKTTGVATNPSVAANLGTIARVDSAEPSVTRPNFLDLDPSDAVPDEFDKTEERVVVPDRTEDGGKRGRQYRTE